MIHGLSSGQLFFKYWPIIKAESSMIKSIILDKYYLYGIIYSLYQPEKRILLMDTKQIAEEFLTTFNSEDLTKFRTYLSDDFTFSGPTPEPVNADQWIGIMMGMRAAFPDLNYNLKITGYEDNKVMTSTQLTGTHTKDWDLTAMRIGVVPATGKAFSNPKEEGLMTIENGKITSYFINSKEESGIPGMLKQLGVEVPA
jgi:hypothetical protein